MRIRNFVLAILVSAFAQLAWAADISGTWLMTVEMQGGGGSPTFTLKQAGEAVTGSYKGQLGESPVTGTLKGNDLTLTYKISAQGMDLEVTYTGTVSGNSVSGKVSYGGMGEGTFKGTKQ